MNKLNDVNIKKMLYTDNSKCNYICGFDDQPKIIAENKKYIGINDVDYVIKQPEEIKEEINLNEDKQKKLSYLSVKSIQEGINWYRNEFPKMNEELLPLLSRWNFGDLNNETKKSIKNKRKKEKKKEKPIFKIEHRPIVITFE